MDRTIFLRTLGIAAALAVILSGCQKPATHGAKRLGAAPTPAAPPAVLTRNGDNHRDGVFRETGITIASLKQTGITLRTVIPVTGDRNGDESAPLISPPIQTAKGLKNVLMLASMANVVRGVDARVGPDGKVGDDIWDTTLCNPGLSNPNVDMYNINQHIGVLSGGVIDPDTALAYLVAMCSPDGNPQKGIHYLYTLDLKTGAIVGEPASFATLRNGSQAYTDIPRKQRAALGLTHVGGHTIILGAHGAQSETGPQAAGAIFAYDATDRKFTVWQPTADGSQVGIWMAGGGLAIDGADMWAVTGNGKFDGVRSFGESAIKATYVPATATAPAAIKFVTHWTAYDDRGRVGLDPSVGGASMLSGKKLAGVSAPNVEMEQAEKPQPVGAGMEPLTDTRTVLTRDTNTGQVLPLVYPTKPTKGGWGDEDLGSAPGVLIDGADYFTDGQRRYCFAGKDGLLQCAFADHMGDTMPKDFANAKANCGKLAAGPVWGTASPGNVDPCPQDQTSLDMYPYGKSRHQHASPVVTRSQKYGMILWLWGENSALHAWRITPDGQLHYLAESREMASALSTYGTGGMPGGMVAASTNNWKPGTTIIWASIPLGDANKEITKGRLLAYSGEDVANDSDGPHLVKLWDSQQYGVAYVYNKFMPPTIWQSMLYLPNYNGGVMEFSP